MQPLSLPAGVSAEVHAGICPVAGPAFLASWWSGDGLPNEAVIVVENPGMLEAWVEELSALLALDGAAGQVSGYPVLPSSGEDHPRALELECDRLSVLTDLLTRRATGDRTRYAVVTTPKALAQAAPVPGALAAREIRLAAGSSHSFAGLAERLGRDLGYYCEAVCEMPGTYAVRGGLLDVYPVNGGAPVRVDFFGDQVESLRTYDPTTQLTTGQLDSLSIAARLPPGGDATSATLLDYLGPEAVWAIVEAGRMAGEHRLLFEEMDRPTGPVFNWKTIWETRREAHDRWLALAEFDLPEPLFAAARREMHHLEPLDPHRGISLDEVAGVDRLAAEGEARRRFLDLLAGWQKDGWELRLAISHPSESVRLERVLEEVRETPGGQTPDLRITMTGGFRGGFRWTWDETGPAPGWAASRGGRPGQGVVLVTTGDILGRYRMRPAGLRRRKLPQRAQVDALLDFSELAEGDHLVHITHGVCIYRGLTRMELQGHQEEVISLEFDEELILHLPLNEAHLLSRYVGLARVHPKLGRIGGQQWEKTRRAAERATLDLAADLLRLQAARESGTGFAFPPDADWQRQFEDAFPHEETPDQMRAIVEAKADMEKPRPMDRLVCGDVGYGKTEVALRAAFKAALASKQVVILAPTTVLAQQHYNTFRERLAGYPITVEMLSRFRTTSQQAHIVERVKAGRVDILIGTHRLLGHDLGFKDLGLVVVDEEHRFGVRHKERLKQMRGEVDILTMSATPIPRTLYMALTGARDLSVIETPPVDRLPIQTFVKAYSMETVREAIRSEVARGGQVFYLHNRVQSIEEVALHLSEAMPELRLAVGHGQMPEHSLERIMTRFVAGEFDVLVCTTIIESGLDIPNCNTIVIEGADRFGLAQLYQLRGRVGRFNRQAYAYLLLHRHARMLEKARERLAAIRQYNQLGAGFRIAMRDLELRGAGNLLGPEQSGHIAGVGFDLYCQLLRQSIARLKGSPEAGAVRASVRLDFIAQEESSSGGRGPDLGYAALRAADDELQTGLTQTAGLPASYLNEARLRIDFYRRLSLAGGIEEVAAIGRALQDRFGPPPPPVQALLAVTEIRVAAEQRRFASVETEGDLLKIRRASGKADDYVKFGHRFPRLTERKPMLRLREILRFLNRKDLPSN